MLRVIRKSDRAEMRANKQKAINNRIYYDVYDKEGNYVPCHSAQDFHANFKIIK